MKVLNLLFHSVFVGVFLCLFGQSLAAQDALVIAAQQWKPGSDLVSLISTEIDQKNQTLAEPQVSAEDRVLFTAYNQVLALVQVDLQDNIPVQEAVNRSYAKVLLASETDPAIKGVVPNHLAVMLVSLTETFAEVPQFIPQTGQ